MYCIKCLCPKNKNSDRKSCRVHIIIKDNCINCNNILGENCYHEWVPNYKYYINIIYKILC